MTTLRRMPLDPAKIARRREQLTLTMEEAAVRAQKYLRGARQRVTCDRTWWNKIESGYRHNPSLITAEAVAYAMECGIDDLRTPPTPGRRS